MGTKGDQFVSCLGMGWNLSFCVELEACGVRPNFMGGRHKRNT